MFTCPKCNRMLPDGWTRCQFCGTTFGGPPVSGRAPAALPREKPAYESPHKWVWPAYYLIAGWWIVSGLYGVIQDVLFPYRFGMIQDLALGFNAISVVVGLGLVFRVELARGILNIWCWLQILLAVLDIYAGYVLTIAVGEIGLLVMLVAVVRGALAGLMVYLIGETESRAPNL